MSRSWMLRWSVASLALGWAKRLAPNLVCFAKRLQLLNA